MNEHTMRFRVGLFVLAALILLAILIVLFGGLPTFLKQHHDYTIRFKDAPNVGAGTPVRRSGVRIGEVESLTLDDNTGEVVVHVLVDKQHAIRRDDQPVLNHSLLGGDTTIDLVQRPSEQQAPDKTPIPPGSQMTGKQQPDARALVNQTAEVLPSTQETLNEIRKSLRAFDPLAPQMSKAIAEYQELAKATREVIPELRRTNEEVRQLARASRDTIPDLRRTNDELRELAKAARETIPELRRTNDEIQATARNWGKLGERLDVLLQTNEDKLVKTLDNLNDTLVRIGTVFSDENQRNLTATLKNVRHSSDTLESITRNTDDLLKESRQTIRRVNDSVGRADDVLTNLQLATKPMAERSGSVMKNLDESTGKLNQLLFDVRDLLHGAGQGDGTLRRLLTDPTLYNNLNDAACALSHSLPRLDRILHDVEVFADKIARHPESLGVGGVVSPSSGLKEVPPTGSFYPNH